MNRSHNSWRFRNKLFIMSKRALKSKNSKSGSRKQQMKMNDENVSLVMSTRDINASPDVECQKITHNEYRHKKFKRIASADIDGDYNQEKQSISTSSHSHLHINETTSNTRDNKLLMTEENQCRFGTRDIKANEYESPLPTNDISQSVSSDLPLRSCFVSADDIIKKSTKCQDETLFAPSGSHTAISSQQPFGSNVSFNERYKPYKPKFHEVPPTDQNSENMLLKISDPGSLVPIDFSKKSCTSLQAPSDSDSMISTELEPLNLSMVEIETNRKKLPTVEPLHGISSTSNSQYTTYLDEPIASPGPFLGKTRLVEDYNRQSMPNQPNQTVNNNLSKMNYIEISAVNDQFVDIKSTMVEKTNEHLPMTKVKEDSSKPHNNEIIQLLPNTSKNAIELNIISSTSELVDHRKVADPVKLDASAVDSVSMQIAEVSSSVNTSLIARNEPNSRRSLPIARKPKTAVNIASEYIELTNKQINSTTNDEQKALLVAENQNEHAIMPDVLASVRPKSVDENGSKRPNITFIRNGDGPLRCTLCSASFPKSSLLKMHMNIHYMNPERKFHCDSCDKSFRTQNRLQKHVCFETKISKVNKNPRPFKCSDCSIAFRIHGHLAKHLRSKTHIQNLENLQKIPSGTYAMIEKAQINLTDIDTTDCDNSLASLKLLAIKLNVDQNSKDKQETVPQISNQL